MNVLLCVDFDHMPWLSQSFKRNFFLFFSVWLSDLGRKVEKRGVAGSIPGGEIFWMIFLFFVGFPSSSSAKSIQNKSSMTCIRNIQVFLHLHQREYLKYMCIYFFRCYPEVLNVFTSIPFAE